MKYILIKLGGGLITDKSEALTPREDTIKQLADELGKLYTAWPNCRWIIGNGAGSFGHYTVHKVKYKEQPSNKNRISAVRESVEKLNKQVVEALNNAGFPAVTVAPHKFIVEADNQLSIDNSSILGVLEQGKVPVVYGDVISSGQSSRIISTEELLEQLSTHLGLHPYICIYATAVGGVLDINNRTVSELSIDDSLYVHQNNTDYDVTGGMVQKVSAARNMAKRAKHVYILNGTIEGEIGRALNLEPVGTRLKA